MLESERSLWLRAVLWLAPAPVAIAFLAYAIAPWVFPAVAQESRVESSLAIGFGTSTFFTGVLLLGVARGRRNDFGRADWIWYLSHALALMAIGIGLASFVWFPAGVWIGVFGVVVSMVGFSYLAARDLVRWVGRLLRSRDRGRAQSS